MSKKEVKQHIFRLDEEQSKNLEELADLLEDGTKNKFLKNAIRFFKENTELYRFGKVQTANDTVTKADLLELKDHITQQFLQQQKAIQQMAQLIADQEMNGVRTDHLAAMKEAILSCDNQADLESYSKVEEFLLQSFPEWESEITEEKIYNEVLYELMQQGTLQYNTRSKKFKWRVIDE